MALRQLKWNMKNVSCRDNGRDILVDYFLQKLKTEKWIHKNENALFSDFLSCFLQKI